MNFGGKNMFCPNCGKQIDDNVIFCGECGTRISTPETKAPVAAKKNVDYKALWNEVLAVLKNLSANFAESPSVKTIDKVLGPFGMRIIGCAALMIFSLLVLYKKCFVIGATLGSMSESVSFTIFELVELSDWWFFGFANVATTIIAVAALLFMFVGYAIGRKPGALSVLPAAGAMALSCINYVFTILCYAIYVASESNGHGSVSPTFAGFVFIVASAASAVLLYITYRKMR